MLMQSLDPNHFGFEPQYGHLLCFCWVLVFGPLFDFIFVFKNNFLFSFLFPFFKKRNFKDADGDGAYTPSVCVKGYALCC